MGFRRSATSIIVVLTSAAASHALTDLMFYSDAGCGSASPVVSSSWVSCSKAGVVSNTNNLLPVSCAVYYAGTDAIDLNVATGLASGDWYDIGIAMPDWSVKSLTGYVDLRFFTKNVLATPAKFNIRIGADSSHTTASQLVTIPANQDWTETVLQLSSFGSFATLHSKASSIVLDNPPYGAGVNSLTHVYIDNVRITDGTGSGSLSVPSAPGGKPPAGWPAHFSAGCADDLIGGGSTLPANLLDFRCHYLNWDWTTNNHWYGYIGSFIANGKTLAAKTAFVWYFLTRMEGSASEINAVNRLAKADTMTLYFDTYDAALAEMAAANQPNITLVLEPDFYGFIMDYASANNMNAADITVRMEHASALAGATYPNTVKGLCQYLIFRAHQKLPGSMVGHMISHWNVMGGLGQGSIDAHLAAGLQSATFINSLDSAGKGDLFFVEKADRDAGQAGAAGDSSLFWTKPNYDKYFAWVKIISNLTGLRSCGWQISEGNMGNAIPRNRDDAVQYFVSNSQDWVNAGFIGSLFGGAASIQNAGDASPVANADYRTDDNWFVNTMRGYYANPTAIRITRAAVPLAVPSSPAGFAVRLEQSGNRIVVSAIDPANRLALFGADGRAILATGTGPASVLSVVSLPHGIYFVRLENPGTGRSFTCPFVK